MRVCTSKSTHALLVYLHAKWEPHFTIGAVRLSISDAFIRVVWKHNKGVITHRRVYEYGVWHIGTFKKILGDNEDKPIYWWNSYLAELSHFMFIFVASPWWYHWVYPRFLQSWAYGLWINSHSRLLLPYWRDYILNPIGFGMSRWITVIFSPAANLIPLFIRYLY